MKKLIITALILTVFTVKLLNAQEKNTQVPDVSIGVNANFGAIDFRKNIKIDLEPGVYAGGGFSAEKMIYNSFGFGSGIQYRYFRINFEMYDDNLNQKYDTAWTFQAVNVPVFMIISLKGERTGLNITAGVVYSHILHSIMTTDTELPLARKKDNVSRFTNTNQIGLTAGIIFKIKATEFTDFIIGINGEYFPTNLLDLKNSDDKLNQYNCSLTTGWMFRTNLFPGGR